METQSLAAHVAQAAAHATDAPARNGREPSLLLRIEEVAHLLRLGRSTVYQMIAAGELRAVRRGRAVRVERAAVEDWIRGQGQAA